MKNKIKKRGNKISVESAVKYDYIFIKQKKKRKKEKEVNGDWMGGWELRRQGLGKEEECAHYAPRNPTHSLTELFFCCFSL